MLHPHMCGCSDLSAQARRREDCEKQHAPLRRALLGGHQAEPPIVPLSSLYPQALFPLLVCAENSSAAAQPGGRKGSRKPGGGRKRRRRVGEGGVGSRSLPDLHTLSGVPRVDIAELDNALAHAAPRRRHAGGKGVARDSLGKIRSIYLKPSQGDPRSGRGSTQAKRATDTHMEALEVRRPLLVACACWHYGPTLPAVPHMWRKCVAPQEGRPSSLHPSPILASMFMPEV